MFGFIVGTLSLIGLIKVWRWGHHGRHGYGGPRRWMMRRLFEHLDTTPGQEKVVAAAVEDAERKAWDARDQFFRARAQYAKAVRGEHFDNEAVSAAFDAQQAAFEELKKSVRTGLQQIHEALNPEQRARLGDLIEYGPRHMHGCGGHHFHHGFRPASGGPSTVNL